MSYMKVFLTTVVFIGRGMMQEYTTVLGHRIICERHVFSFSQVVAKD